MIRLVFFRKINPSERILVTYGPYAPRTSSKHYEVREMRKLPIAIALAVALCTPVAAQEMGAEATAKPARVSVFKAAMNEVAIMRYRAALKLKADQEKYWPAVASALRALAREPQLNEAAVRRFAPAASALFARLDDDQKQTAMRLVQKAGLTQYASLF
jgi:hypothetical protein